jgi:hypothetical protein
MLMSSAGFTAISHLLSLERLIIIATPVHFVKPFSEKQRKKGFWRQKTGSIPSGTLPVIFLRAKGTRSPAVVHGLYQCEL